MCSVSFLHIIVSTNLWHENENTQKDTDAFDFQEIKSGAVLLYFDNFYSLILAADIVIYLSL